MITHAVFFWLKNPASRDDCDTLIAGVRALQAIEQVRSLVVGVPAPTGDRDVVEASYGVSEILTFDTIEDEAIYQDHPLHQSFIAKNAHLWTRVTVYDVSHV